MLERYGGPAVFLGRFVAFARAIIPALAGMSGLRYRTFLFYNACGGLLWGVGYTLLGFVVGISFEHILSTVGLWSIAVVGGIAVVAVAVGLVMKRRERSRLRWTGRRDRRPGHRCRTETSTTDGPRSDGPSRSPPTPRMTEADTAPPTPAVRQPPATKNKAGSLPSRRTPPRSSRRTQWARSRRWPVAA